MEYTVRHGQLASQDRICHRRTTAINDKDDGDQPAGSQSEQGATRGKKKKAHSLRDSFAKLDADGTGNLSLSEIISAASLVGLRFDEADLSQQLLAGDRDGDGTFELHELDEVLREDQKLESIGIERYNRPLLFDVLPLVARSFDAHATVEAVLNSANERDRAMATEGRRARMATTRELTKSANMAAVKRAAKQADTTRRKSRRRRDEAELPEHVQAARRAASQSTIELAELVDRFEARVDYATSEAAEKAGDATAAELENFDGMAAALDDACVACNSQRSRLAPTALKTLGVRPARHHDLIGLTRSRSKPAFEHARRPTRLPPLADAKKLPRSASQPHSLSLARLPSGE